MVVKEGLLLIHGTAVKSIQSRQSKGRTYVRGGVSHTASKPGNPPNTDTGQLVQGIAWQYDEVNLAGVVGTNVKHGAILELTPNPELRRPWLKPAWDANIDFIVKRFEKVLLDFLKKATKK